MSALPIDPLLPQIVAALRDHHRLVLRAAPGAGKTTRVPAALLDAGLAGDKEIVVLEPRRIAARAAADFVARARGGAPGGTIGYRVRFEQRGDAATRLWFVTEGVLGRQLARDPFLERVGIVVLDEFHERHLQGDIALAVIRELQQTVRPDLKLVVMSATLETDRLAAFLDDCPILTSEGRAFPVTVGYSDALDDRLLPARIMSALRTVTDASERGDVLVFLPGAAEIRRTAEAIAPLAAAQKWDVLPLHGNLPLDAQHRVLQRGLRRKIVLATNVAETALTVEGVTTVIDSGLARVARFDAKRGINALRVVPISRAAADQRAGRAGRLAPGQCLRLWTASDHAGRRAHEVPEVLRLDLSATVLELRAWGLRDLQAFAWLDAPLPASLAHAERLLVQLAAVDGASGELTDIGRRLLTLSAPPRIARMMVEALKREQGPAGALLAALASERDVLASARQIERASNALTVGSSDLLLRVDLFLDAAKRGFDAGHCRFLGLDPGGARAVERARRQLCSALKVPDRMPSRIDEDVLLRCTLAGFPDRVVRRRAPGSARGVMAGGAGVILADSSIVREAELFVALEVDAGTQRGHTEALVRTASAVDERWLEELFPGAVVVHEALIFDAARRRIVARTQRRYEDIVLAERIRIDVDALAAGEMLAEVVAASDELVPKSAAEEALFARLRFLQRWMPELALPADPEQTRREMLSALCAGCVTLGEVEAQDVLAHLRRGLTAPQRHALDQDAPADYLLPSGRRVPVQYDPIRPPAVAARIQELFGLTATPRLARGRVPLLIEILAPNQRPVQITDDLHSFWQRTYPEVRKQLRGRYPKHPWPEDPLTATPTARAKPRVKD